MFHPFHGLTIFKSATEPNFRGRIRCKGKVPLKRCPALAGIAGSPRKLLKVAVLWFPPPESTEHRETNQTRKPPIVKTRRSDSNKCLDDFCNGVVVFSPHKDSVLIYHWIVQQTCGFWRFLLTTKRCGFCCCSPWKLFTRNSGIRGGQDRSQSLGPVWQ